MDEEVGVVALRGRSGVVNGRPEVVSMEMRTRDDQNGDVVRIKRLKSSIGRIREQIEQTRKELGDVCENLRGSGAGDGKLIAEPAANGNHTIDNSASSPITSLTDDEVLGQARVMVNGHVKTLTRYNETKDVAMVLFELLAEYEGVRVGEVLRDRGVEFDD